MRGVELKPCPFCGGEAYINWFGNRNRSQMYSCRYCGCTLETNEEDTNDPEWNKRVLDQEDDE